MYLAVDPGAGNVDSIGCATFLDDGSVAWMGQFTFHDFINWLESLPSTVEVGVYEEYRIYKKMMKAHVGSKVETIQSIGALRSWAMRNNVQLVAQRADILGSAQKLFQIKIPDDHTISHQFSALLHGMYWLYGQGKIKSALEIQMAKERGE